MSNTMKDLEIPCSVFNPICKFKPNEEVIYNRYSNHTYSIENASIFSEDTKASPSLSPSLPKDLKSAQSYHKNSIRQPGFPLIIELKTKKNRSKLKKQKSLSTNPLSLRPKLGLNGSLYSSMNSKIIYVMSAKLIKKVTMIVPKSILSMSSKEYAKE